MGSQNTGYIPTPAATLSQYTYIINQSGGVYYAFDGSGKQIASNAVDVGPILQTLINILIAGCQGGKIYIKAGTYMIGSTMTWTVDPNSTNNRYMVGVPIVATAGNTMEIVIEGECGGGIGQQYTGFGTSGLAGMGGHPTNNVGVQFLTNVTSTTLPGTSNQNCSMFYCLINPAGFGGQNYVNLRLNNTRWTQQTNQWLVNGTNSAFVMINAANFSGMTVTGTLSIDTASTNSAAMPQSSQGNLGLICPSGSNQGGCHMDQVYVAGYQGGVAVTDHSYIDYLYAQACRAGIWAGTASFYAKICLFDLQECEWMCDCRSSTPPPFLIVDQLNIEVPQIDLVGGGTTWNWNGLFVDAGNGFVGSINYSMCVISQSLDNIPSVGMFGGGTPNDATSNYTLRELGPRYRSTTGGAGITGSAKWAQPDQGNNFKQIRVNLAAYKNTNSSAEVITFIVPFVQTPRLVGADDSGGATFTTTTLTLPASMATAKTGYIVLEGK